MLEAEQQKHLVYYLQDILKMFFGFIYTFFGFVGKILSGSLKMLFPQKNNG
jgi:hypothetical protein